MIDFKTCLRPGIILALQERFGMDHKTATEMYDYLEANPGAAEKMFPPAEEDEG